MVEQVRVVVPQGLEDDWWHRLVESEVQVPVVLVQSAECACRELRLERVHQGLRLDSEVQVGAESPDRVQAWVHPTAHPNFQDTTLES